MEAHDVDLGGEQGSEDDPFKDVPGDPIPEGGTPAEPLDVSAGPDEARLGGTDEPVAEAPESPIPEPAEGEYATDPEEDDEDGEEAAEDPDESFVSPPQATTPEPEPEPEEPEPEPEPDDEPPPAPVEDDAPKGNSAIRTYIILEERQLDGKPVWAEREPIEAHNTEGALRRSYKRLYAGDGGDPHTPTKLVAVPERNWKPQPVKGDTTGDVSVQIG